MSLEKRIAAIERKLNATRHPTDGAFRILVIEGGVGEIRWSYAGALKWKREPEETLENFTERSAAAAIAAGETSLVVGGLPRGEDEMAGFADFEAWFQHVQPNYSDVPPEEAPGYAPKRSQW
jgi:hypothetical protein